MSINDTTLTTLRGLILVLKEVTDRIFIYGLTALMALMILGVIPSPYISSGKPIEAETLAEVRSHSTDFKKLLETFEYQNKVWRIYCRRIAKTDAEKADCDSLGR